MGWWWWWPSLGKMHKTLHCPTQYTLENPWIPTFLPKEINNIHQQMERICLSSNAYYFLQHLRYKRWTRCVVSLLIIFNSLVLPELLRIIIIINQHMYLQWPRFLLCRNTCYMMISVFLHKRSVAPSTISCFIRYLLHSDYGSLSSDNALPNSFFQNKGFFIDDSHHHSEVKVIIISRAICPHRMDKNHTWHSGGFTIHFLFSPALKDQDDFLL